MQEFAAQDAQRLAMDSESVARSGPTPLSSQYRDPGNANLHATTAYGYLQPRTGNFSQLYPNLMRYAAEINPYLKNALIRWDLYNPLANRAVEKTNAYNLGTAHVNSQFSDPTLQEFYHMGRRDAVDQLLKNGEDISQEDIQQYGVWPINNEDAVVHPPFEETYPDHSFPQRRFPRQKRF